MDESAFEDDRKPAASTDIPVAGNHATSPSHSEKSINVKPALKSDSRRKKTADMASGDKHLKWDEQAIEEHDQLRGTRMKIDEPNTPYTHYDSGAESDDSRRPKSPANQKQALSWDTLQTRLDSVAAVREQYPPASPASSQAETDQPDEENQRRKEMRKLEFKEHRKRHYNEMELVKKFRQEHPYETILDSNGNDDDDGDADDEVGNVSE